MNLTRFSSVDISLIWVCSYSQLNIWARKLYSTSRFSLLLILAYLISKISPSTLRLNYTLLPLWKDLATSTERDEKSRPKTNSKLRVSSKVVLPTEQPISKARNLLPNFYAW